MCQKCCRTGFDIENHWIWVNANLFCFKVYVQLQGSQTDEKKLPRTVSMLRHTCFTSGTLFARFPNLDTLTSGNNNVAIFSACAAGCSSRISPRAIAQLPRDRLRWNGCGLAACLGWRLSVIEMAATPGAEGPPETAIKNIGCAHYKRKSKFVVSVAWLKQMLPTAFTRGASITSNFDKCQVSKVDMFLKNCSYFISF